MVFFSRLAVLFIRATALIDSADCPFRIFTVHGRRSDVRKWPVCWDVGVPGWRGNGVRNEILYSCPTWTFPFIFRRKWLCRPGNGPEIALFEYLQPELPILLPAFLTFTAVSFSRCVHTKEPFWPLPSIRTISHFFRSWILRSPFVIILFAELMPIHIISHHKLINKIASN